MIHVNLEVMSWLKEHFNYKGKDKFLIKETVPGGCSVIELLRVLAGKYPVFGKKAFSVKQTVTFDYCAVGLNGRLIIHENTASTNQYVVIRIRITTCSLPYPPGFPAPDE